MVVRALAALVAILLGAACGKSGGTGGDATPTPQPRTFRMGFSSIPPRVDLDVAVASIDLWSRRADAGIFSMEPPWDRLLAGEDPEAIVAADHLGLAQYYRAKGFELWVYLDPGNGLKREGESDALVAAGRSIKDAAVQQLFRRFAAALAGQLRPEHMGLVLESNLIRGISPPELYAAIRQVANDAAADVRARHPAVKLGVSVQVDWAWGRFGVSRPFEPLDTDLADFPFIEALGLSSYPYLAGFATPEEIPLDYYSRVVGGRTLPVAVTEGGWTSASLGTLVSSPELQRRYIARQMQILDAVGAVAVFQLTFTDIDLQAVLVPEGSIVPLFAHNGLVDVRLQPKPALAEWDKAFARPRR
jgi:hypothetical protein